MKSKLYHRKKFHKQQYIILFDSYLYTVKSVYRKKKKEGIQIFLKLLESNEIICFNVSNDEIDSYSFLKKGRLITVHLGNGGYCCIQEGNHMPEDGQIYSMKI